MTMQVDTFLKTARKRAKNEEGSVVWTTLRSGIAFFGCPHRGWRFFQWDTPTGQCAGGFVKEADVKDQLTALWTGDVSWSQARRVLNGKTLVKANGQSV